MSVDEVIRSLDIKKDLKDLIDNYWSDTFNNESKNRIKSSYWVYHNYVANCKSRKLGVINEPLYKKYNEVLETHYKKNYVDKYKNW